MYRTREEVEDWKQNKDPIKRFRDYLTKHKLATKKELDEIDAAAAEKAMGARLSGRPRSGSFRGR